VKRYLGGRRPYYRNKHQGEVDMMRAARRLWNRGLASISKVDGLNYITIDEGRVRQAIRRELAAKAPEEGDVYLIKGTCKTQTSLSRKVSGPLKSAITGMPRRCSNHRLGACRHLKGIRWMSESDRDTIASYYNSYINDIDEKIIALLDGRTDVMLGMEYSTRFNDMNKAKRNLDNFEDVIRASFNLNNKERKAVFLTLTSDPNLPDEERQELEAKRLADLDRRIAACTTSGAYLSHLIADRYRILGPDREIADLESINRNPDQEERYATLIAEREEAFGILKEIQKGVGARRLEHLNHRLSVLNRLERHYDPEGHQSLWDVNRSFSYAWNGFLSFLKKRLGYRPQYVCAFEYTDTGLMHCHAMIFVPYLLDIHDINMEWERLGQGRIGYVYGLKARFRTVLDKDGKKVRRWEWKWSNPRNKPKDCKEKDGGAYLEKYLKKAVFARTTSGESPSAVHSAYWSFNKRFWTCSMALRKEARELSEEEGPRQRNSNFRFAGIYDREVFAEMAESSDDVLYAYFRYNSPYWDTFHPPECSDGGG